MRLNQIIFITLLLLVCGCVSETQNADRARLNLNGPVRSFEESYYYAQIQSGEIIKAGVDKDNYPKAFYFSKDGWIEKDITYTAQNTVFNQTRYFYNAKKQLVKTAYFGIKDTPAGIDSSFYNTLGLLIKRISFSASGTINSREFFFYNEKKQLIDYKIYSFQNNLLAHLTYEYDSLGNRIGVYEFEPNGDLNRLRKYSFDAQGNEIEVNWYEPNMSLLNRWIQQWNERGNLVQKYSYNGAGKLFIVRTFQYQYDKHQNWIRQIKFENGNPVQIAERKIRYY